MRSFARRSTFTATFFCVAVASVCHSQTFNWTLDNESNLDLTITGTGGAGTWAGWGGTVSSPSGRWTFQDDFSARPVGLADVHGGVGLHLTNGSDHIAWSADGNVNYNPTGLYEATRFFDDLAYNPALGYYQLYTMRPILIPLQGGDLQGSLFESGSGIASYFRGGGITFTVWTDANPADASQWPWSLRVSENVLIVPEPAPLALFSLAISFYFLARRKLH